jgi:hypothetical protein
VRRRSDGGIIDDAMEKLHADRFTSVAAFKAWETRAVPSTEVIYLSGHELAALVMTLISRDLNAGKVTAGGENLDMAKKWDLVVQGLGRYSDIANRHEAILYPKRTSLWGRVKTDVNVNGWLTMRGSCLSQAQLTKYASSLDAGNVLKAISVQKGQIARPRQKTNQATDKSAKEKLGRLVKVLKNMLIHPAQK